MAAISVIVGSAVTGKCVRKTESRTAFASVICAIIRPEASMAPPVIRSGSVQRARAMALEGYPIGYMMGNRSRRPRGKIMRPAHLLVSIVAVAAAASAQPAARIVAIGDVHGDFDA